VDPVVAAIERYRKSTQAGVEEPGVEHRISSSSSAAKGCVQSWCTQLHHCMAMEASGEAAPTWPRSLRTRSTCTCRSTRVSAASPWTWRSRRASRPCTAWSGQPTPSSPTPSAPRTTRSGLATSSSTARNA